MISFFLFFFLISTTRLFEARSRVPPSFVSYLFARRWQRRAVNTSLPWNSDKSPPRGASGRKFRRNRGTFRWYQRACSSVPCFLFLCARDAASFFPRSNVCRQRGMRKYEAGEGNEIEQSSRGFSTGLEAWNREICNFESRVLGLKNSSHRFVGAKLVKLLAREFSRLVFTIQVGGEPAVNEEERIYRESGKPLRLSIASSCFRRARIGSEAR